MKRNKDLALITKNVNQEFLVYIFINYILELIWLRILRISIGKLERSSYVV